jgi:undecaprenyl-diphosphatase
MTPFDALIYGIIQGLSEFLPISSSGHLALLPHLMKINDPGVVFDLMMHLGTGMAVAAYFREDILRYIRTLGPSLFDFKLGGEERWFVRNFIFSTLVSVVMILLLIPFSKAARDPWVIIVNLSVFGLFLWVADILNKKRPTHLETPMLSGMQWKLAGLIGLAQSIAIFPGVSRSGITLTVALLLGMRRTEAGSFSFLLSLPIIFAGILKEIPDLVHAQNTSSMIALIVGVVTSFSVGWITIHFFMKLIGRIQLGYFSVYRWLIAGLMMGILF